MASREPARRFRRLSATGILFEGGAAAVDSSTIIARLVHGLTGNMYAVGAASAILRYGWLSPQLFVGYLAQHRARRMPFYMVGALANGATIAMLGYLMEISPDDRRPAYSGYFNALVAPAALLPLAGAAIVEATALEGVFAVSLGAALLQFLTVRRLRRVSREPGR